MNAASLVVLIVIVVGVGALFWYGSRVPRSSIAPSPTPTSSTTPLPSSTPLPGSTGSLLATCRRNGVNVKGATVSVGGLQGTTGSDGTVLIQNIPAGTYSGSTRVVASASGLVSISQDLVITAGTQASATFNFGVGLIVTVTPFPGANGKITPSGPTQIGYAGDGSTKQFTIQANSGFTISSIIIDTAPIIFPAGASSYTVTLSTSDVQTPQYLYATFKPS
jgi:hypothetical protein